MTSIASLGFDVKTQPLKEAKDDLDKMAKSAKVAEVAAESLGVATDRAYNQVENAAEDAAEATRAYAAAQNMAATSARLTTNRLRAMTPQVIDVTQSLALGMPPLMVFAQQGGQIAQIYGMQGGGLGAVFADFGAVLLRVGRFLTGPIGLALSGATALALGFGSAVSSAAGESIGLGETAFAAAQLAYEGFANLLAPAVEAIAPLFATVWDAVSRYTATAINTVIGIVVGGVSAIGAAWEILPGVVSDVFGAIGHNIRLAMTSAIRDVVVMVNGAIRSINGSLGTALPDITPPSFSGSLSYRSVGGSAGAIGGAVSGAFGDAQGVDYLGGFAQAVANRALANRSSAGGEGGRGGGSGGEAARGIRDIASATDEATTATQKYGEQLVSTFGQDLAGAIRGGADLWDAFKTAGLKAIDSILTRLTDAAAGNIAASLFGGRAGGLGGLLGGIFGGFRADGGPVTAGRSYVVGERGPEVFRPTQSGAIIPNGATGGGASVNYAPVIDARGADASAVARLERQMQQQARDFGKMVAGANRRQQIGRPA